MRKGWIVAAALALAASMDPAGGPARAQTATPAPAPPAPAQPAQPAPETPSAHKDAAAEFGQEVMLSEKTILVLKGTALWDSAFETLMDAFKTLYAFLDREKIKPAGAAMTIYTATDDTGFQFEAAVPIAEEPKSPPKGDIAVAKSPEGKALKFIHRGSYDAMDTTYDAITNYLDERKLEAKDLFLEEYVTDILTTPEDKLVVEVYVPIK